MAVGKEATWNWTILKLIWTVPGFSSLVSRKG